MIVPDRNWISADCGECLHVYFACLRMSCSRSRRTQEFGKSGHRCAADGAVISGPSLQPLAAVAMSIAGTDVVVDLARSADPGSRVPA
jgi:hypothetical protein